ncbi:MAG TPA: hypothetical protein VFW52_01030 [Candidatus Saccharimonadales bacterium]|nr:hypothetical protein [Candidatus Saccharimonadales bacterium]
MEILPETLPESRKVFEAVSNDGALVLSVWDDSRLIRQPAELNIPPGILTIYNSMSRSYYCRERVELSESAIAGSGPTDDEKNIWAKKLSDFAENWF